MTKIPKELKYSSDHEWVRVDGEFAYIGITDFAQRELGDIVFVEIETEGENLAAGDIFGSVEAVKTVSDLYMPVSGEVLEVNEIVKDNPEIVNSDPYGDGWMIKVKISDSSELDKLMDADAYQSHIG